MPKVLIAAAGGRVARRVAAELCARSEPPRALVRNASKAGEVLVNNGGTPLPLEMVVSDFTDRDGLRRALAGIEIAFLALGSSLQQVELEQHFIDVAAEVGLPHLVELSAAAAPVVSILVPSGSLTSTITSGRSELGKNCWLTKPMPMTASRNAPITAPATTNLCATDHITRRRNRS
jgi:nucleoside-diphosphate-sugar epimerase